MKNTTQKQIKKIRGKKENKLVVGDMGWANSIPKWLTDEIKSERLVYGLGSMINPDCPKVGDAEVVAYLMTASLHAPMYHEYNEIYVYLTAKMLKKRKKFLADFMEKKLTDGLTTQEQRYLRELQHTIYAKRGGQINHPILNLMRAMKKNADAEGQRLNKTKQQRLIQ